MQKYSFYNEFDNLITIKVKKQTIYNNSDRTKGVNIQIIGPTSISENIITMDEFKQLYKLMGKFNKQL